MDPASTTSAEPRTRKPRASAPPPPAPKSKKDQLIDLLRAKGGADVRAVSDTLGWQAHTVRAALTGLRKTGVSVEKLPAREGELTRYRIAAKRDRGAQ
jgi:predicted ArsR family transcriptional regulator